LDGPLFDGILKTVITTVATEILTCEKQSVSALRYLATGNAFEVLKGCISVNWNCCAGDEVTAGQTDVD